MSTVHDILSVKGTHVHKISESASVLDAVKQMNEHRIGCLVVTRADGSVSGVIAERDVLRRIAKSQDDLSKVPVNQAMTSQLIVCRPSDSVNTVRAILKTHWLRQIPVVDNSGQLEGLISIGDVNAYLMDEKEVEIKYLHDYID